jgi:hypothetical protein
MGLRNKLKKAAMTGAALFGASKLMGAKKTAAADVDSGRGGTSSSAKAREKTLARPSNLTKDMGASRSVGDVKTVKPKGNEKSIYVQDDGSIQKGDKLYKDKITYKNRDKSDKSSSSDTMTRDEKRKAKQDAFNKKVRDINAKNRGAKKGKMMKLYSGGMAVSGKGQGIVLAGKNKKTIIC